MDSKVTIVLLFLVLLHPALQLAAAGETRSCSDIRTSYNSVTDLRADAFTLRPEDPRWPSFLEWAKAKKIYTFTIVGLSGEGPQGIIFRWAKDTAWQKDVVVPFGQALAHIIAERQWRDTDFPEFFDSRGGVYDVNIAERLAEIESQTLTPWREFFQTVTMPKKPGASLPQLSAVEHRAGWTVCVDFARKRSDGDIYGSPLTKRFRLVSQRLYYCQILSGL